MCSTILVILGEEAAFIQIQATHILRGRRVSFQNGALHTLAVTLDRGIAHPSRRTVIGVLQRRGHGYDVRQVTHGHRIVVGELFTRQHLRGRALPKYGEAEHKQNVRPE